MGSNNSRKSHFQRPDDDTLAASADKMSEQEDFNDNQDHHISISNKMVERLVEDAALEGGAAAAVAAATGQDDYLSRTEARDRVYTEKLKRLDDIHSEKCGVTIEEANALARRVELRTAIILGPTPVCEDCEDRVIQCYSSGDPVTPTSEAFRCWSTVDAFTACVAEACATRLRASSAREAREKARRSLQVTHAREHSLRELRNKSADIPV